ncbi:MAG: proteasome activator [Dermatophilaceae bacterium]
MDPTSLPPVVSLSKRRDAKRDRAAFAGRADVLAAAVVADRALTAFQPGNAHNEFARWYADAAGELLVVVVAAAEPATSVDEVLALGSARRQGVDLLLVLTPEHSRLVRPGLGRDGAPVQVWEYDDRLMPWPAHDSSGVEVRVALPRDQPVRDRDGDLLSHELREDWLKLLGRPPSPDLTQQQLATGARARGLTPTSRLPGAEIPHPSIGNLEQLSRQLIDELERIALPFNDHAPSDAELHIAATQLDGWLDELSHSIQTELFALQMAAQQKLRSMAHVAAGAALHRAADAGRHYGPGHRRPVADRIGQDYRESGSAKAMHGPSLVSGPT